MQDKNGAAEWAVIINDDIELGGPRSSMVLLSCSYTAAVVQSANVHTRKQVRAQDAAASA